MKPKLLIISMCIMMISCGRSIKKESVMEKFEKGTFGYDLKYLTDYDSNLVVLSDSEGKEQLIVSALYQAKVFTSTADGVNGNSLGFVNYKVFESGAVDPHMNGFGGENRFWIGPEGGQFSVFFEKGKDQVYDNWHTPKAIDTEQWDIKMKDSNTVYICKTMEVTNYKGYNLEMMIRREISLVNRQDICSNLKIELSKDVKTVAYNTINTLKNLNTFDWTTETGTVCIWMLDMFNTAPRAITIVPFISGDEDKLGKIVTSDYFGEIPSDRLKTINNIIYLKTDGKFRSKIGLNPRRTVGLAGNYDPDAGRLTVITFDVDKEATYLNQEWNIERNPLIGDALNAYNDGPLEDGSIMGPFLELESVSPAAFLSPSQSLSHNHTVYHFIGDESMLSPITEKLFNVKISELINVF